MLLRVIAGVAKKRRLKSPGKLPIRPTGDKVKGALFNIIGGYLPCSFADLYAGTGAVGIEALSRGAEKVLFVEQDHRIARILKDNLSITGLSVSARLLEDDIHAALAYTTSKKEIYDIVFADPPYRRGLAEEMLYLLGQYPILSPKGMLVLEVGADEKMPEQTEIFLLQRRVRYGDTALVFYQQRI